MADYIPKPDEEARVKMAQIVTWLSDNAGLVGLTPAEVTALDDARLSYFASLKAVNTAKTAQQNAVATKDGHRSELEVLVRAAVQRVQVNPAVTDAQRIAAGIPVRDDTRSFNAPTPPLALQATADASGFNALTWEPGSNAAGARYVIEARIGAATEFATVDVVTATTYKHQGRTPGQPVIYRVLARRGEVLSQPSNTASVYL